MIPLVSVVQVAELPGTHAWVAALLLTLRSSVVPSGQVTLVEPSICEQYSIRNATIGTAVYRHLLASGEVTVPPIPPSPIGADNLHACIVSDSTLMLSASGSNKSIANWVNQNHWYNKHWAVTAGAELPTSAGDVLRFARESPSSLPAPLLVLQRFN